MISSHVSTLSFVSRAENPLDVVVTHCGVKVAKPRRSMASRREFLREFGYAAMTGLFKHWYWSVPRSMTR